MPSETDTPAYITKSANLADFVKTARSEGRVGVDTEGASFHRYFDRVFLIQASTKSTTAIIDPLELDKLSALGKVLADRKVEVVFHDADFDLRSLNRDYGFTATALFDTRIAAQLLGEPGVGLGALLEKYFSIKLDKKFQRADWSRRPLEPDMLEYAANDTRYLLELRDRLADELKKAGRLHWAEEEFRLLEDVKWAAPEPSEHPFLKIKGVRKLDKDSISVLAALFAWRESEAQRRDRPVFRVMSNQSLLKLAQDQPSNQKALVEAVSPKSAERYGKDLLAAIAAGQKNQVKLPPRKRTRRPKPDPETDRRIERLKKLRVDRARELGLEQGVLCPNATIQGIARANIRDAQKLVDSVEDLRNWQLEALGEDSVFAIFGD